MKRSNFDFDKPLSEVDISDFIFGVFCGISSVIIGILLIINIFGGITL